MQQGDLVGAEHQRVGALGRDRFRFQTSEAAGHLRRGLTRQP
jgi:hypothetical protein